MKGAILVGEISTTVINKLLSSTAARILFDMSFELAVDTCLSIVLYPDYVMY